MLPAHPRQNQLAHPDQAEDIGLELAAGLTGEVPETGITLIASGRLQMLYQLAFETVSVSVRSVEAEDAVRRGLSMAAESFWSV